MKVCSVDVVTTGDNSSAKVAIFFQGFYSILGLLVGTIFLVSGSLLLLSGIAGSSHFVASMLGSKLEVTDASAGLILAVLGALAIFITRYEVQVRTGK